MEYHLSFLQNQIPDLEPVGPDLISGPTQSPLTENYVGMQVCPSCLLNNTQGPIVSVGLLVCISRENRPCQALPNSFNDAKMYSEAKSNDFRDPYLTTPRNWEKDLRGALKMNIITFTIGNVQTCPQDPKAYCNGPLPDGADVRITVISCTSAGCDKYTHSTIYKTKAASDDDVPIGAIIGAIIAVIVLDFEEIAVSGGSIDDDGGEEEEEEAAASRSHSATTTTFHWRAVTMKNINFSKLLMSVNAEKRSAIAEPEPLVRRERPILARNFPSEVARYHKDANMLFQDDFEDIKKLSDFKHSSDEAKREENRVKNRYVNILPYDHSRVKLSIEPDEPESMDFINANYIPGFNSVREYIASQGPMYCTIPDFWRMMWEQNSRIIVMLSDLQEAGKRKVDLYWPENLNEPINYGNIVVEMTNFSQLNKYTIRNFTMSWGENEPRKVTHFFLAGWLDFSANLKFSDVIEFVNLVRQEARPANSGPITVHCSAGVGRTGTFIALDYFMQHLDKYGLDKQIDIFSYVMRMRYNRPTMVQAESQYVFIYDALLEVINKKIEEEENVYNNVFPGSDTKVDMPKEEESIYMNTNGQGQVNKMQTYDNKAFDPDESDCSKPPLETKTPTTIL
ncbi:receptor-type tyrosine-protein phosphatase beta [Elysia marginata]|uniref:protein-tyrosine-phosphatase n=1 Tax=Elysia marginata TaxID=1093978 RepID=A0AAV4HVZ8_9GAST|nr:receptor-type tyrosine-protein phosphatase beta [Elysia marginata]